MRESRSEYLGVFEYLKVGFVGANEKLQMQRNRRIAAEYCFQLLETISTDTISLALHACKPPTNTPQATRRQILDLMTTLLQKKPSAL